MNFGGLKWVLDGIGCGNGVGVGPRVQADDNWNMKIYNKKQYMYFICTFELYPHFVNYKRAKQIHNSRIVCIN